MANAAFIFPREVAEFNFFNIIFIHTKLGVNAKSSSNYCFNVCIPVSISVQELS